MTLFGDQLIHDISALAILTFVPENAGMPMCYINMGLFEALPKLDFMMSIDNINMQSFSCKYSIRAPLRCTQSTSFQYIDRFHFSQ